MDAAAGQLILDQPASNPLPADFAGRNVPGVMRLF